MQETRDRVKVFPRRSFAAYLRLSASICGSFLFLSSASASTNEYPSWWLTRNVITNVASTNDWAAINQGQLKWIATNAYDEVNANLPNGAGTNVSNIVVSFTTTNNYQAVNLGQLKYVAAPFYDRLISEGYTNTYPWTGAASTNDYAMANIGQVKCVFSFDLTRDNDSDGLANWRETGTGIFIGPYNTGSSATNSDTDADGIADGTEVDNRTDPNNNDTTAPVITISWPVNNSIWTILP